MTWGIIFMSLYFWSDNKAVFQISALVIHCLTTIRTCKTFPKNGAPGTCFVNRPYWIQLNESSPLRWGHVEAPWWCGSILKLKNKTNTHKALWGNFCSGLVCKELTNKVLVWLGLFTQAGHIQPRVMLHQDHRRRSQERLSGTSVPKTGMRSKPLLTCMSNPASKKPYSDCNSRVSAERLDIQNYCLMFHQISHATAQVRDSSWPTGRFIPFLLSAAFRISWRLNHVSPRPSLF